MSAVERDRMDVDVVIVGAGPAGLSAAIQLKKEAQAAGEQISVVVVEKSAEIGGHILSGAVIDPRALDELIPDWAAKGAPLKLEVTKDKLYFLTKRKKLTIPHLLKPPLMRNKKGYIASLGALCEWLAEQAEILGVDIFTSIAASQLIFTDTGAVKGIITGDFGLNKDGTPSQQFQPGMQLHAKYTLLGEGARGSLSKIVIDRYNLQARRSPQKFALGIKEIWEVSADKHRAGEVSHYLGWPMLSGGEGGGFMYHGDNNKVQVGYVVHLNYSNPYLSPFEEFQRFKTHPAIAHILKSGCRTAYGARVLSEGGWQSIPKLGFPGGALLGCAAGLVNVPRIKGIHNAIYSGLRTAQYVGRAVLDGRDGTELEGLDAYVKTGPIAADLRPVKNVKPLWSGFGFVGLLFAGLDMWFYTLFKFSLFGTLPHRLKDHKALYKSRHAKKPPYEKPDGQLTFDRLSSLCFANIDHDENQPIHLKLIDEAVPLEVNLPHFDEPARLYCPARVYEIDTSCDKPQFVINAANCIHCKACDVKDPKQNIIWTVPQGGSGPNYSGM